MPQENRRVRTEIVDVSATDGECIDEIINDFLDTPRRRYSGLLVFGTEF